MTLLAPGYKLGGDRGAGSPRKTGEWGWAGPLSTGSPHGTPLGPSSTPEPLVHTQGLWESRGEGRTHLQVHPEPTGHGRGHHGRGHMAFATSGPWVGASAGPAPSSVPGRGAGVCRYSG